MSFCPDLSSSRPFGGRAIDRRGFIRHRPYRSHVNRVISNDMYHMFIFFTDLYINYTLLFGIKSLTTPASVFGCLILRRLRLVRISSEVNKWFILNLAVTSIVPIQIGIIILN